MSMTGPDDPAILDEPIRFRLLGPLQILGPTGTIRLHSARQRSVLTMLLVKANRPVAVDRLVDAVWGDEPPSTARNQIQICVSRLRMTFRRNELPDVIETVASGYLLRTSDHALDIDVLRKLTDAARHAERNGRPTESLTHLRHALALWRGNALSDGDGTLIRAIGAQLDESRLTLIDELVTKEHQMGRYLDSIEQLTELVRTYPLHERLWVHFMTALYRTGRRADALTAYQSARDLLVTEVGIEPGEELRRIHGIILIDT
jgi:DNA-binding SARP family transcriptional activator